MKIEKGKKYRCLEWHCDMFTDGKIYQSLENYYLINNNGIGVFVNACSAYFELVEEPTTEELLKRIEDLSANVARLNEGVSILLAEKAIKDAFEKKKATTETCPTAAKFKAIAEHANAINDIIKNAPE